MRETQENLCYRNITPYDHQIRSGTSLNPCTGSNTQIVGRRPRRTVSISGVPNFSLCNSPVLSPTKSGVTMFDIFAPARRSFRFNFFRTLSSVVMKVIFIGLLVKPGGSRMQDVPLLNAAMIWHHSVVFPTPPSAAISVICPAGIHPGITHSASSGKVSRDLNRESNVSPSCETGAHTGIVAMSVDISSHTFS